MIEYGLITRNQYKEIAQFLLDNFFLHEPFGLALGLTVNQVERWFPQFLDDMLAYSEPVSFVSTDSTSGKIVGVILNIIVDPAKPPPPNMMSYLDPEKEPVKVQVATFLEKLEDGVDAAELLKQPPTSKTFACLFISVAGQYGGQGIAKELLNRSESKAKEIPGVTIAMTDVTSAFSYTVFKKFGYEMIKEVEYLSYADPDGSLIFSDKKEKLGVHTHARVVAKLL